MVFDLGDAAVKFSHVQRRTIMKGSKNSGKKVFSTWFFRCLENISLAGNQYIIGKLTILLYRDKLWMSRPMQVWFSVQSRKNNFYNWRPCAVPLHPWLKQMRQIIGTVVSLLWGCISRLFTSQNKRLHLHSLISIDIAITVTQAGRNNLATND